MAVTTTGITMFTKLISFFFYFRKGREIYKNNYNVDEIDFIFFYLRKCREIFRTRKLTSINNRNLFLKKNLELKLRTFLCYSLLLHDFEI